VAISNVVLGTLAGFAFSRLRFKGRDTLFLLVLGTAMVPTQLGVIPLYMLMSDLYWYGTLQAVIVPVLIGSFAVFWMRQACEETVPYELIEAAKIDGAGPVRIFWSIVLPLSGPVYATAFIIDGIAQWNSFLRPLIVLNQPESYPLSVGLRYFVVSPGDGLPKDHLLMAAAVMMTVPVILIFFVGQRYFVRGVAMTGIKG
jgi:cellobiose transport system permease protein